MKWKLYRDDCHFDSLTEIRNDRGDIIAQANYEKDARLIAAAPEMLEALKAAQHQLWLRRKTFSDNDHGAMNLLSAAIAKAEKGKLC